MMNFLNQLLSNQQTVQALWLGAVIALVSALVGVFVVLRGQSFAGHVLTDIGVTGASGAYLVGLNAWYGFLGFGLLSGATIESLGNKARNRDIATGIVLSLAMGLGALFLYLDARVVGNTSASQFVLFGSLFAVQREIVMPVAVTSGVSLALVIILYRPLLLSSISPQVARAKGIPVRTVSLLFMVALAIAVEDSSLVVGALMSTALLIGPAYAATRLTRRPHQALFIAGALGIVIMLAGTVLAYSSADWPPIGTGWPVSFFIALLVILPVLAASAIDRNRKHRTGHVARGDAS